MTTTTATTTKANTEQTKQLCENGCGQVLHEDICIFVWNKNDYEEEMTICEYCNDDIQDELRENGWLEEEDMD